MSLNKAQLVDDIAKQADGLAKKDIQNVVDAFLESVQAHIAAGTDVNLMGFGRFTRTERAARSGRNPRTGAKLEIPASVSPQFKAGKAFKDRVNG